MRKKIIFILIILSTILIVEQISYAAIEIVPSKNGKGTDLIVNKNISESYLLCLGMKGSGESLKGTTVQPHLATNKDWGAVSYLSRSIYGNNSTGGNKGIEITIDNVKYYSTTSNITGVMNWGSNPNRAQTYTQTSSLIEEYLALEDKSSSIAYNNVMELEKAINNLSNYVEILSASGDTKGMAIYETKSFSTNSYFSTDTPGPISIRDGLFGFNIGFYRTGWRRILPSNFWSSR